MRFRKCVVWLLAVSVAVAALTGCHRKEEAAETTAAETPAEETSAEETSAEGTSEAETEDDGLIPEMKIVTDAVHGMIDGHGFSADTVTELSLNGGLVSGDYEIRSDVQLLRGEGSEDDLQMTTVSSSDMDDIVTKSYYRDGIYHVSDGTTVTETEESADTVTAGVSQITDMVLQAAGSVETVDTEEEENGKTSYTYEIPEWLAEDYLKTLVATLQIEDLDGAKISLDQALLTTEVDEDGLVTTQTISLEGEIHVSILSVPASVKITADFEPIVEDSLDFSDFDF